MMSPPAGAERLADPDFPGPLGDRDQHDVHDADPADHQAHRRDAGEEGGEDLGGLLLGGQNVLRIPDGEVVVGAGADLVLPPENALQVHHPLLDRHAVLHLDRQGPEPVGAEDPVLGGLQRDQDLLVGVGPEAAGRALLAQHPGDLERDAPDEQRLVDHRAPGCRQACAEPRTPSTAYRWRASSSPAVNIRPKGTV